MTSPPSGTVRRADSAAAKPGGGRSPKLGPGPDAPGRTSRDRGPLLPYPDNGARVTIEPSARAADPGAQRRRPVTVSMENAMKVADVMTRDVVAVPPAMPLKDVAALMIDKGISGVPVVDDAGAVLGVVSEADFVIKERGVEGVRHRFLAGILGESRRTRAELAKIEATTAGEAMTSPALTVESGATLQWVAGQMANRGINRLPVVEAGVLVGIVTRADVVRAYVRPDAELELLVREEVLAKTAFWLEPESFEVSVHGGVVRLAGRVERRSLADTIVEVTYALGGIVGVESNLTWEVDDVDGPAPPSDPDVLMTLRPH